MDYEREKINSGKGELCEKEEESGVGGSEIGILVGESSLSE
jgi:hypothetical protein